MTSELRNWSGTYRFTARQVIAARTIDEVRRAVAGAGGGGGAVGTGGRVRAVGTRHSFNDLADNGATLVSVTGIAPDPVLDEASRTVTVGAGTSYGVIAAWLQERGWALPNLGSLPHISVAGAIATGTHGSGNRNRILSAAVAGLEYVDARGELQYAGRSDPDFSGMVVGLGAFGIVVRVTLDIEPSYLVRQDVYPGLAWDRVLADIEDVMGGAYSVSLFTDWTEDSVRAWVKRRLAGPELTGSDLTGPDLPGPDLPGPDLTGPDLTGPEDAVAIAEFFGASRDPGPARLVDAPVDNLTVHGLPGPWSDRLPHFRLDVPPSNGDEIQSEYFVDRRDAAQALDAVRRLSDLVTPLLLVSEIRSTAPDGLWLSGSYDRETLAIHFTWRNHPDQVDAAVPEVEEALAPFGARPHWGKVSHVQAGQLESLYPRLGDARALFERLDPDGRFSNNRLERLGVRAAR